MKNVQVLYSFPNPEQNKIVTVKLLETENDVRNHFANHPAFNAALREFKNGKQLFVNSAGGWCWLTSNSSNGCNIELVNQIKTQKSVTFV